MLKESIEFSREIQEHSTKASHRTYKATEEGADQNNQDNQPIYRSETAECFTWELSRDVNEELKKNLKSFTDDLVHIPAFINGVGPTHYIFNCCH